MIHFMVDLENTGSRGLQGVEYLESDDRITIFYSQSCLKIERGKLQQIAEAGSKLSICRLQNVGKNALDFYIASRIGEVYGKGYEGLTAIVSNDKGFKAIQDYWQNCALLQRRIILKPDIEQSILSSNENSDRRRTIQKSYKKLIWKQRLRNWKKILRFEKQWKRN